MNYRTEGSLGLLPQKSCTLEITKCCEEKLKNRSKTNNYTNHKKCTKGLIRVSGSKEDPSADTQWNDILCKKGILPPEGEPEGTGKGGSRKRRAGTPPAVSAGSI